MTPYPLTKSIGIRFLLPMLLIMGSLSRLPAQKNPDYCVTCACDKQQGQAGKLKPGPQTWKNVNFHAQYPGEGLVGKSFEGDTFIGCSFDGVDLTNVSFKGATFQTGKYPTTFSGATLKNTCFVKTNMHGSDLQYANYEATDFRCANLLNTIIGPFELSITGSPENRVRFNYAKINVGLGEGQEYCFPLDHMPVDNWKMTDFSYTNFINLNKNTFHPKGKDMSNAKLEGIKLLNFDLSNCNLTEADLSYAKILSCHLDHTKLYGISLASADISSSTFLHADFYDGAYRGGHLTSATLSQITFLQADLEQVVFTDATLSNVKILDSNLANCNMEAAEGLNVTTISNCDFSGSTFKSSSLNEVSFKDSKLIKTIFSRINITGTTFIDCIMPGVIFENESSLQDVDFSGAQLYNANFGSTDLGSTPKGAGVNLSCTQLGGADLSNAILDRKVVMTDAVMPMPATLSPKTPCCKTSGTIDSCGLIIQLNVKYGYTKPPILTFPIRCPNDERAICSGLQWKVKNWTGISCGTNKPLWTPPKCNSKPPAKGITIPDKALKQCIVDQVFGPGSTKPLTAADALQVTDIDCVGRGIKSITGLDKTYFPNLVTLDLSDNLLTSADFSNFSTELVKIDISHNRISTLKIPTPPEGAGNKYPLGKLNDLDASFNQLKKVVIPSRILLNSLKLSNNRLVSFDAAIQTALTYLDLSSNQLTSIGKSIKSLQNAEVILLQNNKLTTIGEVNTLMEGYYANLSTLDLQNNPNFQCSTLNLSAALLKCTHCK